MREIPDEDQDRILNAIRKPYIRKEITDLYWQYKWLRDVFDASPLTAPELTFILMMAGEKGEQPEERVETAYDQLVRLRPREGTPIMVQWRNRPIPAEFFAITPDGFTARLEGEPDVRTLEPTRLVSITAAA